MKRRALRIYLAPPGSWRAHLLLSLVLGIETMKREGLATFILRQINNLRKGFPFRSRYSYWIKAKTPHTQTLARQRKQSLALSYRPLISLITLVDDSSAEKNRGLLDSVWAQTYENWELLPVINSSQKITKDLQEYTDKDARIRPPISKPGLSAYSQEIFSAVQGEYLLMLPSTGILRPETLFESVRCLNEKPASDVIYFDEDRLSTNWRNRREVFFKPDWSPEMLLSTNYISPCLIRRSLALEAINTSKIMEGTQDWDLVFRVTELTNNIEHIPKVLYHAHRCNEPVSSNPKAQFEKGLPDLHCVENHLLRIGIRSPQATCLRTGHIRVVWPVAGKKVSIIIPTKDQANVLRQCILSIQTLTAYPNYEIILVDNNSVEKKTHQYFESLQNIPNVKLVPYPQPFNYSTANNLGAQKASGEILLFLNNDIEVLEPGWLEEMVRWVERPEIGLVGAKLLFPNRTIQHAGIIIGLTGHANHIFLGARENATGPYGSVDWYRNYSAITGACMMIRREIFEKLGGFDERYILAFSDIELCLQVRQHGLRVVYTPFARLKHYEGKTRGNHIPAEDMQRGLKRFLPLVEKGDPYFNPNLSYSHQLPTIALEGEENRVERLKRLSSSIVDITH